ncbi:flavin reductase family protein [Acinetobacter sp. Ver3]|uniref:flavin reductase family protein n=1 Tax=Acinetobacter sp. Ver3 TaxID=466088 RepID=UPI00044A5A10|nr:iron-sulfur cluster-binding domain-containing protein [Acinetobacter sp. Ver3]EZQ01878.1 oxidoreductase [Acinetobacter sp. Ver3]
MSSYLSYRPEWIREDFVDFIAEKIHPTLAWKKVKASLVSRQALSHDFYEIHLCPNHNFDFQQIEAGQSVLVTVVVAGVRLQRSYSIVEISATGNLVIAVRAQGVVSNCLSQLAIGSVVEISQAQGEFTLEPTQQPIVLLASGSGITAIYALLTKALNTLSVPIYLIYFCRDDAFHVKLQQLASKHDHFNYHYFNTRQHKQYLTLALLEQLMPSFRQAQIYACGATSMMQAVNQICHETRISNQLKQEFFQIRVDEEIEKQSVTFIRSQKSFEAQKSLLVSAEEAGLRPAHGCRMGICNACVCNKVSGVTKNMLTGEIEHEPNRQIKLCISQAVSPVVINL